MDFKENTDVLFDTHKKTNQVIDSCIHEIHIEGARNYVENFRKWLACFECENEIQSNLLKSIIDDVELNLRSKHRQVNCS